MYCICNFQWMSVHLLLALSNHLIFTYFWWSALSPPWIPKLGASPSQRIVCLNWKVRGGKPTNVASHFKTTFHFFLFTLFFYQPLHHFHFPCSLRRPFHLRGRKRAKRKRRSRKKEDTERRRWRWDDYMWAGLNDFSPSDSSLLIIRPNSLPPSMEDIPLKIFLTKRK